VVIQVLDKGFFKDKQVGIFELDVAQVYFTNDQHALHHQWVALSNPDGGSAADIKGYVKLSIAVQGPGDSSVRLTDAAGGVDNFRDQEVLMPASIRKEYKQVNISIIEA